MDKCPPQLPHSSVAWYFLPEFLDLSLFILVTYLFTHAIYHWDLPILSNTSAANLSTEVY